MEQEKTTFVKLLTRLYDPTEGEILFNGVNIKKNPVRAIYESFLNSLSRLQIVFLLSEG